MIISIIVLTMIGMEFTNWVVYPVFESKVKILVEAQVGFEIPFSRDNLVFKKSEITQTQSEIISSEPNLAQVVRATRLDERPKYGTGLRDTIHRIFDGVIQSLRDLKEYVKELVIVRIFKHRYTPPLKPTPFQLAVAHLQRSSVLTVEPLANTDLVVVAARDRNANYAAAFANELADIFIKNELEVRKERARAIHGSINDRLAVITPEMDSRRLAVAEFKDRHGIINIDAQITAALSELSMLETIFWDLSQKESAREQSAWEAQQRETTASRDVAHRERSDLVKKKAELAELLAIYRADHLKVIAAQATVDEVQRQLDNGPPDADPHNVNVPLDTDTDAIRDGLLAKISRLREELAELSRIDTRYQTLLWDQEHTGEVLKFLSRKREDASIAEHTTQSQIRIVEPAEPQFKPIRPRKWLNRALALLTSVAVAVGLAALLEYLDRTVRTPEAIAKFAGLRTLGSIPYSSR